MEEQFGYDDVLRALRSSLVDAQANARAFALRARGRPALVSIRAWGELAAIEVRLARDLADCVRLEMREEPWTLAGRASAVLRGLRRGLVGEERLVMRLFRDTRSHPVERWRATAPQLEASLWPFFVARTHHLANAMALALNEPAPFPAVYWHPGRLEFRS